WNCDSEFGCERVIEEFVVGGPPEGVVDDNRAAKHGVLEKRPIERHLMRDSVEDQPVVGWLAHPDGADLDVFGSHAGVHTIYFFDKCGGKCSLHPDKNSDFHLPLRSLKR